MARTSRHCRWLCTGLVLLTALWYGAFVSGPWIYEDANWLAALREPAPAWTVPSRALTMQTYHWTWQVAGLEPALYRIGNLGLHLTAGVLVYAIAAALVSSPAAVWSVGIFLLHPLNTEAARYANARGDLLMTVCILLAVWLSLGRPAIWRWLLVGVALLGAAVSKEIGLVGIPLVGLTLLLWRPSAVATKLVAPVWIALGALAGHAATLILSWLTLSPHLGGTFLTWPEFAALQVTAVWHLLALVVWPDGFSIDHDIIGLGPRWTLVAGLLTLHAAALIAWYWRRAPIVAWGLLFVAVAVFPRLIFRTNEFITEPQMYTAMAGVSVLAGAAVSALWAWRPSPGARRWLSDELFDGIAPNLAGRLP